MWKPKTKKKQNLEKEEKIYIEKCARVQKCKEFTQQKSRFIHDSTMLYFIINIIIAYYIF